MASVVYSISILHLFWCYWDDLLSLLHNQKCLKSLVTIRMTEIFPCLACYSQKLNFFVGKSRQRDTQAP